jgi:uncharacterized protein
MPEPFRVMAKPAGALCNLDCAYCYYLPKRALHPARRPRMSARTQDAYIGQLIDSQPDEPELVIAWQGGEPTTTGLDFYRRAVLVAQSHRRPGQRIQYTLQTNGTLLDDAWCEFLAEHDFLVGISIDGPPDVHDAYRRDRGGRPTLERVLRGLELLKAHGVEWNVLTTVHAANERAGRRVYRFLRDELEARFIQFIPIVDRSDRAVRPEGYGRFLIDVFEDWARHDIGSVFVQSFDTALAHWVGLPGGLCVHDETCGRQGVLEHTGDLYACDHYVDPAHRLGNIHERPMRELIDSPAQRRFGAAKRERLTAYCRACPVRFACNGGCPKDRFARSPEGERGHNYLCPSYERFFGHIDEPMRAMAELLTAGRPPAELMGAYSHADARRGRNEPCTCGSGRKWKQCHGA